MSDLKKIKIAHDEHSQAVVDCNRSEDLFSKLDTDFLTVKLAFTAFVGIIFTIIFQQNNNSEIAISFGWNFFTLLIFIIILNFLLLLENFWLKFKNLERRIQREEKNAVLYNIKRTATIMSYDNQLPDNDKNNATKYIKQTYKLLNKEHKISQAIKDKKTIEQILKLGKLEWRFNLFAWAMLFLSIPILFLFNILNLLG